MRSRVFFQDGRYRIRPIQTNRAPDRPKEYEIGDVQRACADGIDLRADGRGYRLQLERRQSGIDHLRRNRHNASASLIWSRCIIFIKK